MSKWDRFLEFYLTYTGAMLGYRSDESMFVRGARILYGVVVLFVPWMLLVDAVLKLVWQ